MHRILLGLLVLAALGALALATCPADVAWRWLGPRLPQLHLQDVSGTLWHGRAGHAAAYGLDLGTLGWTLQVSPLLHLDAVVQVEVGGAPFAGHGTIERAADGSVAFRDVSLTLPAQAAAPALGIPALQLIGTIQVDVAHARLLGVWPMDTAGHALWRDAAVAGAAQAPLGDLQATFASTADGAIAGVVSDRGGPLQLAGTFNATLGRYTAQARLAARGDNPQLREALQYIGQPQADGSRELLIEGTQRPLF
jgi:general secretion pathway protein N